MAFQTLSEIATKLLRSGPVLALRTVSAAMVQDTTNNGPVFKPEPKDSPKSKALRLLYSEQYKQAILETYLDLHQTAESLARELDRIFTAHERAQAALRDEEKTCTSTSE